MLNADTWRMAVPSDLLRDTTRWDYQPAAGEYLPERMDEYVEEILPHYTRGNNRHRTRIRTTDPSDDPGQETRRN